MGGREALGNVKMSMCCTLSLSAMEMELCPDALRTRLTDGIERASERVQFLALYWLVVSCGIVIKSKQSNTYVIQIHHCS